MTFKVTPRGSGSHYHTLKSILSGKPFRDTLGKSIKLYYPINPVTKQIERTKVKHKFVLVHYDVDHLHARPAKESLGQIKAYSDHKAGDQCEARVIGNFFHKQRTKFNAPKRNPLITYETPNGVLKVLQNIQDAFETHLKYRFEILPQKKVDNYYEKQNDPQYEVLKDPKTRKNIEETEYHSPEDKVKFQEDFLQSEQYTEIIEGYKA